jgi:hypothetical protein
VTTAQTMNVMTFVYPATHDSEIASLDFCRNEYALAESMASPGFYRHSGRWGVTSEK